MFKKIKKKKPLRREIQKSKFTLFPPSTKLDRNSVGTARKNAGFLETQFF